jgi:VCBS repeat-containing protein
VLTNDTDVDAGDGKTVTAVNGSALNVGAPLVGLYGTLTLGANGTWTYALDNADPDTNALAQGQIVSDVFSYTMSDANGATSTAALTITITGANDAPVAVADGSGGDAVIESGVVVGDPSAAGNVLTNDTDPDSGDTKTVIEVNGAAVNVGQPLVGAYGTLTLGADGTWTYALNNADPDTNALAQGQVASDVFNYTMSDTNGATSTAALTITITGGNDAPMVTGAVDSGTVTEGSLPQMSAAGTIDFGDVDLADAHVTSIVPGAGGYLGIFVADVATPPTNCGSRSLMARCWCRPTRW